MEKLCKDKKMNEIIQHIPDCVDLGDEPQRRANFDSLGQLLEIPFVKQWKEDSQFHKFSVDGNTLIAELRGGKHWWVVGYLREPIPELPEWNKGWRHEKAL